MIYEELLAMIINKDKHIATNKTAWRKEKFVWYLTFLSRNLDRGFLSKISTSGIIIKNTIHASTIIWICITFTFLLILTITCFWISKINFLVYFLFLGSYTHINIFDYFIFGSGYNSYYKVYLEQMITWIKHNCR